MIVKEVYYFNDGRIGTRTFSNIGVKIRKVDTDEVYDEAIDVLSFDYEETDIIIGKEQI